MGSPRNAVSQDAEFTLTLQTTPSDRTSVCSEGQLPGGVQGWLTPESVADSMVSTNKASYSVILEIAKRLTELRRRASRPSGWRR